MDRRVAGAARATVRVIVLGLIGAAIWAAHTEMPEMAYAKGRIIPTSPLRLVEHLDGGTIEELFIEEGQAVTAGEPIARLSDRALTSELASLTLREKNLRAAVDRTLRLLSFVRLKGDPRIEATGPGQDDLLDIQIEAFGSQRTILQDRIAEKHRSVAIKSEILEHAVNRESDHTEEYETAQKLVERGLMNMPDFNVIQSRSLDLKESRLRAALDLAEEENALLDAQSALRDYVNGTLEALLATLEEDEEQLALTTEAVSNLQARRERLTLRAPLTGKVQKIFVSGQQEILEAGGLVAEILPVDERLVAELRLRPDDIGHVEIGDPVELVSTTFNPKRFGVIDGTVERISPSSEENDRGETYFSIRIALARQTLGEGALQQTLRPGMEVNASLRTGSRSILEYLVDPIMEPVGRAFNER